MSPLVSISIVTPKPGRFDEFVELQLVQYQRMRGAVAGVRGSRFFRSLDNRTAILVAAFESLEDQRRLAQSPNLQDHLAKIRPLVEPAGPNLYEVAYEFGQI